MSSETQWLSDDQIFCDVCKPRSLMQDPRLERSRLLADRCFSPETLGYPLPGYAPQGIEHLGPCANDSVVIVPTGVAWLLHRVFRAVSAQSTECSVGHRFGVGYGYMSPQAGFAKWLFWPPFWREDCANLCLPPPYSAQWHWPHAILWFWICTLPTPPISCVLMKYMKYRL